MLPRNTKNNVNIPPKEASFDLLGGFESAEAQGNNAMPDLLSESQSKPQGLDDIFGSFAQTNNTNGSSNLPDLSNMGLNFNTTTSNASSNNVNFDPFGNDASFVGNASVLRPTSTDTSPSQAQQPPTQTNAPQANKDPFDFGNLASGLNLSWGSQSAPTKQTAGTSPQPTQFSSPTHQFGGFVPNANNAQQARSPMDGQTPLRPDYSRSHFETKSKQNGTNNVNAGPSAGVGDIFADILGQQGYNFATKPQGGNRSINEMRKEELVKDMDPDKLRIMEWVSKLYLK